MTNRRQPPHVNRKRINRRPTRHIHAKQIERIERTPTHRAAGMAALLILLSVLLLATSCRGRARIEAAQIDATPAALATVTPEPEQIAPPQPAYVATADIEGATNAGPWLDTFAAVAAGLSFVAVCGGAVYLFASITGRAFIRRTPHG